MEQKKKSYIPRYIQQYIKDAERYMAFSALKKMYNIEKKEVNEDSDELLLSDTKFQTKHDSSKHRPE